jgi:hypothetical protein
MKQSILTLIVVWCASHMPEMRRFAAEGRRRVEERFDISRTITTLEAHFASAIADRSAHARRGALELEGAQ